MDFRSQFAATSHTGAYSVLCSTSNLHAGMSWCRICQTNLHSVFRIMMVVYVLWSYRRNRTLPKYILLCHTGPSSGYIVWESTGYTSQSPFTRTDDALNSGRNIFLCVKACGLFFHSNPAKRYILVGYSTTKCCQYCSKLPWCRIDSLAAVHIFSLHQQKSQANCNRGIV